jgi:hypothetical protein
LLRALFATGTGPLTAALHAHEPQITSHLKIQSWQVDNRGQKMHVWQLEPQIHRMTQLGKR